ncbi:MAG: FixG Ig-like domain-containing protein, partial [Phycisphaerales bacterium]|nr:FixG Ig-like domain-containing protein [Phycisphaerales bacterium]
YPLILILVFAGFLFVLLSKNDTNVWIGREAGLPFYTLPSGEITNQLRTRITNRTDAPITYTISIIEPEGIVLGEGQDTLTVQPGEEASTKFVVIAPPQVFTTSQIHITIRITNNEGFTKDTVFEMKGRTYKETPSDD